MGQRVCFCEQQRASKLKQKKPTQKRLSDSSTWESFLKTLEMSYIQERKWNAGRKRMDPLILFKMLVLQQLFNLNDEELESRSMTGVLLRNSSALE